MQQDNSELPKTPGLWHGPYEALSQFGLSTRANASFIDIITSDQSPIEDCRNRRIVGYQGVSDRSSSQRQSGMNGSKVQTGLPSAPARWATDVSTEIIRSRFSIKAPVSEKSFRSLV